MSFMSQSPIPNPLPPFPLARFRLTCSCRHAQAPGAKELRAGRAVDDGKPAHRQHHGSRHGCAADLHCTHRPSSAPSACPSGAAYEYWHPDTHPPYSRPRPSGVGGLRADRRATSSTLPPFDMIHQSTCCQNEPMSLPVSMPVRLEKPIRQRLVGVCGCCVPAITNAMSAFGQ